MKASKILIVDTSAILSGKTFDSDDLPMITCSGVDNELKPGGKDYQKYQLLKEKGLTVLTSDKKSIDFIRKTANETGDIDRLSKTDMEILALAYQLRNEGKNPIILTDDYSIQNLAKFLDLDFENINQLKITKKFKWTYRCRGCGKRYKDIVKTCPICGAEIKKVVSSEENIK